MGKRWHVRLFGLGLVVGAVASVAVVFAVHAFRGEALSAADRRRVSARALTAARASLPSACCKRVVNVSCTPTTWSVCVVSVYIPEPLDACQDWSVGIQHHFTKDARWLETYGCT